MDGKREIERSMHDLRSGDNEVLVECTKNNNTGTAYQTDASAYACPEFGTQHRPCHSWIRPETETFSPCGIRNYSSAWRAVKKDQPCIQLAFRKGRTRLHAAVRNKKDGSTCCNVNSPRGRFLEGITNCWHHVSCDSPISVMFLLKLSQHHRGIEDLSTSIPKILHPEKSRHVKWDLQEIYISYYAVLAS
jgi:hypothetical protein